MDYSFGQRVTIFAPTDMAFREIGRVGLTMDALLAHPDRLLDLLLAHMYRGDRRCSKNLFSDSTNRTVRSTFLAPCCV